MGRIVRILIVACVVVLASPVSALAEAPPGVVRVVMFWMDSCPHCHHVLEEVLPPLRAHYGERLEIRLIELVSIDEVMALYDYADSRGMPKERVAVPFMLVGTHILIGSTQIPAELPGLIDAYLAVGGVDWPDISSFEATIIGNETPPALSETAAPNAAGVGAQTPVVEAVLFTTPDCYDCRLLVAEAIVPLQERYGERFLLITEEIITSEDVAYLYQVAAEYGLEEDRAELPLVVIGENILIGEHITTELPGLIESYLSAGGVRAPQILDREAVLDQSESPAALANGRLGGFGLAYATIILLLGVLLVSAYSIVVGPCGTLEKLSGALRRFGWLPPLLALAGMGVAGYLAYVETQAVQAACGPIGDCNTVQSSPYARLFGVLPVGVMGLAGYLFILGAWFIYDAGEGRLADWAGLALFGVSFGGALFSLYLTYLEIFVIRAVCAWCLSSAVIMALLVLVSMQPGVKALKRIDFYH